MEFYTCPVCGFNELEDPPRNQEICPSCGTQFGYHDFNRTHEELRAKWLINPKWHSRAELPPPGWNPYTQLSNLKSDKVTAQNTSTSTVTNYIKIGHWKIFTGVRRVGVVRA